MAHSIEHQHSTRANVQITLKELFFVLAAKFVDFSRSSIKFMFPLYLHGWNCSHTLEEAERKSSSSPRRNLSYLLVS